MNQAPNIDDLKRRLEEERTLLTEELSSVAHVNPKNPRDWETVPSETDEIEFRDEAADRIEDFEGRQAEIVPLEKRLGNVEEALKRIANGTYGKCEVGNEMIENDRLEANPAARTCKKHLDQENRQ